MPYHDSPVDKSLKKWFNGEYEKQMLRSMELMEGSMRGVTPFEINFDYPIAAIAGKNGAGKSTLIAIASCAYHNIKTGYKLARRTNSYYTFSDFFIQSADEKNPTGIQIWYGFAVNNLSPEDYPNGKGLGYQVRKKSQGGKWNDYDERLEKCVVFLGIERIVPHSERSQSRSYSKSFKNIKVQGWENDVKIIVGKILEKNYDEYRLLSHSKYNLPLVQVKGVVYSGFNMGAGENALFEIFSTIYASGGNALIVIDEIELGLHAEAQKRFMKELKSACLKKQTQIICTTHSAEIFNNLPDEARFYLECINNKTKVTRGISADFAMAKMGGSAKKEIQILVEDDIAQAVIAAALNAQTRTRVDVLRIGSASAMARQLAAAYVRQDATKMIAIFDGDQRKLEEDNIGHAKNMAETPKADFNDWITGRMAYLPGETWPESWLIQHAQTMPLAIALAVGSDEDSITSFLEYSLAAGKHQEFSELAKHIGLSRQQTIDLVIPIICSHTTQHFTDLVERIESKLK
ncbi:AAA family ATPase [uncultured Xylophilus sp.]|uniref:ATP-dependent nuclease n=1 Tax=uncultured Xylophilus sp. TaxID=296832 RepID=UPI0025E21B9D|nr:AAA family ATPase [uncultured Xylophilus sp.]